MLQVNDTIESSFFSMDNPFWYLIALVFGSLLTLIISSLTRKKELVNEAKKVFLERRIERNEDLLRIFSEAQMISWLPGDRPYFQIFESSELMNAWFDKMIRFANSNSLYFTKDILVELAFINNLFKQLNTQIKAENYNPIDLKNFCAKYYIELQEIFSNSSAKMIGFFENDLTLNYKLNQPVEKDYVNTLKRINGLKIIQENNLTQTHVE